ncbi:MAG: low molecular weight phosphatase family protein [Candidatus Paceibacterota bacterium]
MKILFICHGNVGRSQIAEGYYNAFTHSSDASSAGVDPTTPARWQTLAPEILEVMKEESIDLSSKKAKLVTEEMVMASDKIIVLCKKEDCPDFLLKQKHSMVSFWKIEDPFKTSLENLRLIRDKIKLKVFGLLRVY